jgi:hypothetical protein
MGSWKAVRAKSVRNVLEHHLKESISLPGVAEHTRMLLWCRD